MSHAQMYKTQSESEPKPNGKSAILNSVVIFVDFQALYATLTNRINYTYFKICVYKHDEMLVKDCIYVKGLDLRKTALLSVI